MALFEPSCGEAYADVFSDATDTDFCVLGYEGRKLKCDAKGVGGLEALVATFDDDKVQYGLLRQIKMDDGGDSRRVKFVMITWVGESAPAMKKGAVTSHKPAVAELFKGHHVSRNVMERGELAQLRKPAQRLSPLHLGVERTRLLRRRILSLQGASAAILGEQMGRPHVAQAGRGHARR